MEPNFLPFKTAPTLSPEETEIRAWLKKNRAILEGRDASEVASLAVLCGFRVADVCMTLSTFQDAMCGSRIENRAALHVWNTEQAMAKYYKLRKKLEEPEELNLMPQWRELVTNTVTGNAEVA